MNKLEIFGDSILKGVTYTEGKYKIIHGSLEERLRTEQYEVSRHCRMGATISDAINRMRKEFETDSPEGKTVIIEFGGNDSDFNWKDIAENPTGTFVPHTAPEQFDSLYKGAVDMVKARGGFPVISTIIPLNPEKYLDFLGKYYSKENILHWLGDVSALYRWQENYNRNIERIAAALCCPVLDLRDAFLRSRSYSSLFSDDGIHPTEEGHRIIENEIVSFFRQKSPSGTD